MMKDFCEMKTVSCARRFFYKFDRYERGEGAVFIISKYSILVPSVSQIVTLF